MANLKIKAGATSRVIDFVVGDSSVTTGAGLTGLTNATGSLVAYYLRKGAASPVAISLAAGTVGTWSSGGFKEVSSANMPGVYELGIPDAALAAGAKGVTIMLKGAANMRPVLLDIELDGFDYDAGTAKLDLTQAVPTTNTAHTVGDALNAARAQGFGKWVRSGTTLTLYASDGTTVVRTFTLDSATAPLSRT